MSLAGVNRAPLWSVSLADRVQLRVVSLAGVHWVRLRVVSLAGVAGA
jgi:hypothetical protein